MRKRGKVVIFGLVLVLALGAILAACQPTPTTTTSPTPTKTVTVTKTVTAPKVTVTAAAPTEEVYTLRVQSFAIPGTYFFDKVLGEEFVKPLEELSGGRLKIESVGSGAIVPDAEMHTATAKGVIDMSVTANFYYSGTMPVAVFEYGYPGLYTSRRDSI